jgi:hypothetical protein
MDHLYEYVVESGRPVELEALARETIRFHVDRVTRAHRASAAGDGTVYRPSERFEVGQKLVFPALEGVAGVVDGVRPGNNPEYGTYEVIRVKLAGSAREFAAGLEWEHPLNQVLGEVDPAEVAERFAALVAPQLAASLSRDDDWVSQSDRWVLRALLPEINMGHRNLAEAILMLNGGPLPSAQILPELGIDESTPIETWALALDLALATDDRFRNVGAIESPLWALKTPL